MKTGLRRRTAYTLLELLLVMTLMVVLAGVSWTGAEGMYQRHQLREAVGEVANSLLRCRASAVESGAAYQFRFEVGGRRYLFSPFDVASDADLTPCELPESMFFQLVDDQDTANGATSSTTFVADQLAADGWSLPLLFTPDGLATDGTFEVVDEEERYVSLSVRGLTASVSVTDLRRR